MKNQDITLLRSLCLAGFILSPAVTLTLCIANASPSGILTGICYSVLFLSVFLLTCFSAFARKHAYHMLLAVSFIASLDSIYTAVENRFQNFSLLLLALVLFCTVLFIQKMSHFICFSACNLTFLMAAIWLSSYAGRDRAFFSVFYVILFIVAFISLKMKFDRERAVTESEKCYRGLVENSPDAIVVYQNKVIVYANPAALRLFTAKKAEDLLGKDFRLFFSDDSVGLKEKQLSQTLHNCQPGAVELQAKRLDGTAVFCESNTIAGTYGGKPALISILKDISKRRQAEQEARQLAYYDPLTGLPNRRLLYNFLKQSLENNPFHCRLGIFFLDIDNFKIINDTYGHDFGDAFLSGSSKRIAELLREEDAVYRYGGDEFVIVLRNATSTECTTVARRILSNFGSSFLINGLRVYASVSIGICRYPEDGTDAESLLKNADTAMYLAKNSGRNNYRYFSSKAKDPSVQ